MCLKGEEMESKSKPLDPRILRTRQLIKDAFIRLLQEVDVEKITVTRIAELATINRVTFYLHYQDVPDMVDKMADEMIEEIQIILDKKTPMNQHPVENVYSVLENLFDHIAKNANFYKTVLTTKQTTIFKDRLSQFLTKRITTNLEKMARDPNSFISKAGVPIDIVVWYVSSALIGTIIAWLQNDMPYTPHFLAKQFSVLSLEKK